VVSAILSVTPTSQPSADPTPSPSPSTSGHSFQENPVPSDNDDAKDLSFAASNAVPPTTSSRTVPSTSFPSATLWPQDTLLYDVVPDPTSSLTTTPVMTLETPPILKSEVAPQMYNGGIVTEIPFMDESSKWELLSLLGDWYEPKTFDSLFSSIASDAVFFSS